jgi:hypothetical protein
VTFVDFLIHLYSVHIDLHFAYLTINPPICLNAINEGQPTTHYSIMADEDPHGLLLAICPYMSLPAKLLAPRAKFLLITVPCGEFQLKKCDSLVVVLSNYFL